VLDFHASGLDDACISRILAGEADVVVVSRSPQQLEQIRSLRELARVAIVAVTDSEELEARRVLEEGAHELLCSDRELGAAVVRAQARVQAERMVAEHQDRLRSLFNAMSSGVIVTTPDGSVVDLNVPARQYLHLSDADHVVG